MQVTSKRSAGGESGSGPGLRGLQDGFEDGGCGGAEGVGGGQPRLLGYPGDELFGLGFPEAPGVDAHGDHGGGLDEGGDLLVETGEARGLRAGDAGEHLFVPGSGAEDEAVRAGAVQEAERDPGVGGVTQRALALDQDQIRLSTRRLQDELLRSPGDEVRDDGIHADAPPGDDDARLPRRDELGPHAGLARGALELQGRRHLAYRRVRPDGENHLRLDPEPIPGEEGDVRGRLAHVPDPLAGELGDETLVEAAHDLEPGVGGFAEHRHQLLRQPTARRGEPDEDRGRRALQRLFQRTHYGGVTPELRHDLAHAPACERRVDHGDDLVPAVADEPVAGLDVTVGEPALGQDGVAALGNPLRYHRGSTPRPGASERKIRPSSYPMPSNGSSARSIAPSRSTKSMRPEIWAAAEMPSEVSTKHPSITIIPSERAVWTISRALLIPPHLASLTFTPLAHPERGGTSRATMAPSSAITGTGWAASVALRSASGPAEAGTGCSIMRTPMLLSSAASSGASSGEKASLASTQISALENSATARTVSTSSQPPTFILRTGKEESLLASSTVVSSSAIARV